MYMYIHTSSCSTSHAIHGVFYTYKPGHVFFGYTKGGHRAWLVKSCAQGNSRKVVELQHGQAQLPFFDE